MFKKILLSLLVIFIVAFFIGNFVLGQFLSGLIDEEVKSNLSKMDLPFDLEYGELSINPIMGKVSIEKINVTNFQEAPIDFKCDEISLNLSLLDGIKMASRQALFISSFDVMVENPTMFSEVFSNEINFGSIEVYFDGNITEEMLNDLETKLPHEEQNLGVSFSDLKVELPAESLEELDLSKQATEELLDLVKMLASIDDFCLELNFSPDSKQLSISELSVSTPFLDFENSVKLNYTGQNLQDILPEMLELKSDFSFSPNSLTLGIPELTGSISLNEISSSIDILVDLEDWEELEDGIPQGSFSMELLGLQGQFTKPQKRELSLNQFESMLGVDVNDIRIDKASVSFEMQEQTFSVSNTSINTSHGSIDFSTDISIVDEDLDESIITEGLIVISDLSPEFKKLISDLELSTGETLPRDGQDIILDFSGEIGDPKIKGLNIN
jgi:hypothetical protein